MRVLYWTERFWPDIGGVEVASVPFIHSLTRRGHEFRVVTCHGERALPDESEYQGIHVSRLHFHRALLHHDLEDVHNVSDQVAALKEAFQPDLIHLVTAQPSLYFFHRTKAAHPAPALFTVCEPPLASSANSMLGRALCSARWVAAVSQAMLTDARALVPEITPRSSVIHNGLEPPDVAPTEPVVAPPTLLCLGRLVEEKGFDTAIEALARLLPRFPSARLIVAGDGPARAALERRAVEMEIGAAVRFTGWVEPEKVPELIAAASVVVVPSRWREPFGLVALEAAQMGRPVVAARVGGLPEIVLDGVTGFLAPPGDAQALAAYVERLIESPGPARAMGAAARARAGELFTLDRHVRAYEAIYRRVGRGGE